MRTHSKKMKSWSTLRGANISVGHGNLLKILTVTENAAKGNSRNWEERENELQSYEWTSWCAGFNYAHFKNMGHIHYYAVTNCKLICSGLVSFIYAFISLSFPLSCKMSTKWILAIIFCYFHFHLPYQIYLSVIATIECQVVYKAHLFFVLECVCHAGVTSTLL